MSERMVLFWLSKRKFFSTESKRLPSGLIVFLDMRAPSFTPPCFTLTPK